MTWVNRRKPYIYDTQEWQVRLLSDQPFPPYDIQYRSKKLPNKYYLAIYSHSAKKSMPSSTKIECIENSNCMHTKMNLNAYKIGFICIQIGSIFPTLKTFYKSIR